MVTQLDVECMSHALRLAKRGIYTTRPNPNVGCVILNKQQKIVGEGYHRKAGHAHAEIYALQQAGEYAKGASAYVTLEPCCHTGKTGPCVDALIGAGISKVVIAMRDPNPLVSGNGVKQLIEHGIAVTENVLTQQATDINRGFIKRMINNLPWVAVKTASSMDGRVALNNGESKWITSEQARYDVQKLRARHDAIMTGIGTVLADDPSLNVRINAAELNIDEQPLQPLRIVIDPELKISSSAKMFSLPGDSLIVTQQHNDTRELDAIDNCKILKVKSTQGRIDLKVVLQQLAKQEINNVLVEAGPGLLGELLKNHLVDELIQYIAPSLLGNHAKGIFDIGELTSMEQGITLEQQDIRQIGKDIRITSLIKH